MGTDVSTPLGHTDQRLGYTVLFSEKEMVIIQRMGPFYCHDVNSFNLICLKFDCVVVILKQ